MNRRLMLREETTSSKRQKLMLGQCSSWLLDDLSGWQGRLGANGVGDEADSKQWHGGEVSDVVIVMKEKAERRWLVGL